MLVESGALPYGTILRAALVLAALVVGLGVAIMLYRRWMARTQADESGAPPWTLQDLRELRDHGEITIPEYERLRAALLGSRADSPPPERRKSGAD